MADQKDNKVEVVNPSVSPVMNQYVVIVLTILVAIAGVLSVVPGMPPAVQTVSAAVIAIAGSLHDDGGFSGQSYAQSCRNAAPL